MNPVDIRGREIQVGDLIAYAGRGSCFAYLRIGRVEEIVLRDGQGYRLVISPVGTTGSLRTIGRNGLGHVVVIGVPEVRT